jgi:hypothetical protein
MSRIQELEDENRNLQELLDATVERADAMQKELDDRKNITDMIEKSAVQDMISQMDTDFLKAANKVYEYHYGVKK